MRRRSLEVTGEDGILSRSLRSIRRKRGLTAAQVASAMTMPLRTYEEFEAGRGPQTTDRIFAFAEVVDCDPFALVFGTIFGLEEFALDCADTKLCLIMMMHLEEFAAGEGGDIAYLEPPNLIGGFARLFKEFGGKLEDREKFLQSWLDGRTGSIALRALRLRGIGRGDRRK